MRDRPPASLHERLRALAAFLRLFEQPGFAFGAWVSPPSSEAGVVTMPYYALGEVAAAFESAAYAHGWVLTGFDWPAWSGTPEATGLRDRADALAAATPEQLARLLTVLIRQERFSEGTLAAAFDSGLLTNIARRAAALAAELE